AADFHGLNADDLDAVGAERDHAFANVEGFVPFKDGREFHAADGATPSLIGLDPGMHGALVIEQCATAPGWALGSAMRFRAWRGRVGRSMPSDEPAGCGGEQRDANQLERLFGFHWN